MAYIGRQLARGENRLFDDISGSFNGSTTVFNLTVSSVATATATPYQLFVSLGGVMQKPNTDFTTAGNQITFTTAPAAGLSCWIMMQGDTIDNAAVADASITPSKISGSNFAFSGDLRLKDADGSHYVGFASPTTVTTNKVWTLPAADGTASQYLQTNGSGVLTWASVTIGGASGIDFNDNIKARWGTGNDLEIFHNSSNSVINDAGTGDLLLQVGGSTKATVSSTGFDITGALTVSTNAVITGDLTVSGTTTTINTQTLDVEDKNVVIGKVSSPSDTTADGGGWTLKGATDKTLNWVNATDAWTSSEHIHLIDNKKLFVGGASGTTDGLEVVHDGSNSILNDTGTGALKLQLGGSTKLEITSGGIDVTGAITVDGAALSTAPTITAVASGTIAANAAVNLKSDGKVEAVAAVTKGATQNLDGNTSQLDSSAWTYDTEVDKIVVWYRDSGNLKAKVGTISGSATTSSISWGSATSSLMGSVNNINAYFCPLTKRHLVVWNGNGDHRAMALTLAANGTLTAGSQEIISTQGTDQTRMGICQGSTDTTDNEQIFVAHGTSGNNGNAKGRFMKINPGDNSITMGTAWSNVSSSRTGNWQKMNPMWDGSNQKIVLCYNRGTDDDGYVSCYSKTHDSWGTRYLINSTCYYPFPVYLSEPDSFMIWYLDNSAAEIRYKTGSYSGNNGLSLGSAVTVHSSQAHFNTHRGNWVTKNTATGTYFFVYSLSTGNKTSYVREFTVAANGSITLEGGNGTQINANETEQDDLRYDDANGTILIGAKIDKGSDSFENGAYVLYPNTTSATAETFIGFSSAGYTNGQTATINVVGNTTTKSSLTPGRRYYVQNDGSLALTPVTNGINIVAGKALTATSLLINPGD